MNDEQVHTIGSCDAFSYYKEQEMMRRENCDMTANCGVEVTSQTTTEQAYDLITELPAHLATPWPLSDRAYRTLR